MHPGSLTKYWHTVRYLKPIQIRYQIQRKLLPPRLIKSASGSGSPKPLPLEPWPQPPKSYLGGGRFRFLNVECDLGAPIDWTAAGCSRLWQYNLHYFHYLHQGGMTLDAGLALMRQWVHDHPPARGAVGWEPYPISLRLVSWIKYISKHRQVPEDVVKSIALQTENLTRQIEYHLLGNHLWSNGKALWFAGSLLGNNSIEQLGQRIILEQLEEQFLPDGGHFELSPMYHAIALEDILDLMNLCIAERQNEKNLSGKLGETAGKALSWLAQIASPNGSIPLLNDSANGQGCSYAELKAYAERLNVGAPAGKPKEMAHGWRRMDLSGYQVILRPPFRILFDTAPLGPDYIPGHAHSDMLSILLEFDGESVFTDTGVFEYEESDTRRYSRSTPAHNTVSLDGLDQAELWKSFRMGRRGYPMDLQENDDSIRCGHSGFSVQKNGLMHHREVRLEENGFEVIDEVNGPGDHRFESFLHCSPSARIVRRSETEFTVNHHLNLEFHGSRVDVKGAEYFPEFGVREKRPCFVCSGQFSKSANFGFRCTYSS